MPKLILKEEILKVIKGVVEDHDKAETVITSDKFHRDLADAIVKRLKQLAGCVEEKGKE